MATGPCQAGFAGTHYHIYLGGRVSETISLQECMTQDIPLDSATITAGEGRGGPDIGSGVKKDKRFLL
jgi:hypothetical protein